MEKWVVRIKVLLISGVFASIANWISTMKSAAKNPAVAVVMPHQVLPAICFMFVIILIGCSMDDLARKYLKLNLPNIIYISLLTVLLSIPGFSPFADFMKTSFGQIGLLPLCTPILAYAGIAIGKDLDEFKKQGLAIMCTACLTFIGTYMGSAFIAQAVLKATGVI